MREPVEELFPAYSRTAYRAIKAGLGALMKRLYDVKIEGLHKVPVTGPAIVAAMPAR